MFAALLYLMGSLWLLSLVLKMEFPRLYTGFLDAGGGFGVMFMVWFIPHVIVIGLAITGMVWIAGGLSHPIGLVALCIHVVCWADLLRYQVMMGRRRFLLDDVPLDIDRLPFFSAPLNRAEVNTDSIPDTASTHLLNIPQDLSKNSHPSSYNADPGKSPLLPVMTPGAGITALIPASSWAYLVQRHPESRQVERLTGIPYRTVNGIVLKLDVYRARMAASETAQTQQRPCVMVIHGGGWVVGDRRQFRRQCIDLARDGFIVFSISYRLAPRAPLPAAVEDCKAAIVWIKDHAVEYGGRPDFLAVTGGSAGGHLAALMALAPNVPRFQPGFEDRDTRIQAAVFQYGVMDWTGAVELGKNAPMKHLLERMVVRVPFSKAPDLYRALEPLAYRPQEVPPILLIHGTYDRVVNVQDSRRMYELLRAQGGTKVHRLEVPNAPHAFDVFMNPLQQRSNWVLRAFLRRAYWDFMEKEAESKEQAGAMQAERREGPEAVAALT